MEYKYELVNMDGDLPIKIIYHDSDEIDYVSRHWHESVEISYVISGKIDNIYIEGTNYTSEQGDIVLINSNCIHSFTLNIGENRRAFTIFIPCEFLKANYPQIDQITFDCISKFEQDEQRRTKFNELRANLDSIITAFLDYDQDPLAQIKLKGLSCELIYLLLKNFSTNKNKSGIIQTTKHLGRLTLITNFIKEHCNQNISIDQISNQFGLSSDYLSRFFQKYIGMTILNYINAIRLEKSYRDLMNTDCTITHIAYEHGFPNEKSFNRVFKEVYKETPNEYRKKHRKSCL